MKIPFVIMYAAVLCVIAVAQAKILDSLTIQGLFIQQPGVVENAIGLKKGSEFSSADVQAAIKKIYRLGLFRTVEFYVTNETDTHTMPARAAWRRCSD